jgi:putative transposase
MDNWPHAPLHWFKQAGLYCLTASTYMKEPLFPTTDDLDLLQELFFDLCRVHHAQVQAWSFFPNHHHAIVESPPDAGRLRALIHEFHSISARERNQRYAQPGRRAWFHYWDTHLTFQRSYLARLNYVNQNPVHHGVVARATNYRWCPATWFEANAKRSFVESVRRFGSSRLQMDDEFDVQPIARGV